MSRTTVLVVDDDHDVLDFITENLTRENFRVLTASAPALALRTAANHPGSIDLLITGVFLDGRTGLEIADQIAQRRSDIKVLFITGALRHPVIDKLLVENDRCVLHKPFTVGELLIKIRTLLDGAEPCTPPFAARAD